MACLTGAALACLWAFRRVGGRLAGVVVVINRALNNAAHRLKPCQRGQVVKVAAPIGQAVRKHGQTAHATRRRRGFVAARIVAALREGLRVIIAAQHQQGSRVKRAQSLGYMRQVARVKGHGHRAARGFMQACARGVALTHQHRRRGPVGVCVVRAGHGPHLTQQMPQSRLAPALDEKLVRALAGFFGGNALHVPQSARRVAHWHQQPATGRKAHAVGLYALARQVGALARVAGCLPQRHRLTGRAGLRDAGFFTLLAFGALTLTPGQYFGVWFGGYLVTLGQLEALFFGQVQQRANAHSAACLDALPSAPRGLGGVAFACRAPGVKQIKAGFVCKLAFDGHAQPRPFITGQAGRYEAQSIAD